MRGNLILLKALLVAVASAGLGLLAVFLVSGDLNWWALTTLDAPVLLLGFGLLGLNYLLGGLRLCWLTSLAGEKVSFWANLRAYLLGLVSAAITPGGSGNVPAVALGLQQAGVVAPKAWSVTLYTSTLDLFFIAWSAPLSLVVLGTRSRFLGEGAAGLALGVSALCLGLWFLFAYRLVWLERFVASLFALPLLRRWQSEAEGFFKELQQGTSLIAHQPLWVQAPLAVLTALQHLSNYLIFYTVAAALGRANLLPTLAVAHLSTFASYVVPTPGGSGFLEVAMTSLLGSRSAPAVVAWRLISFYTRFLIAPFVGGALVAKLAARGRGEPLPG